jgi:hypothetical protein
MPFVAAVVGALITDIVALRHADARSGWVVGRHTAVVARALVIIVAANASKAAGELSVVVALECGVA